MFWLWIILAYFAGAAFGVTIMCCFSVASEEDKRLEKLNKNNKADTE